MSNELVNRVYECLMSRQAEREFPRLAHQYVKESESRIAGFVSNPNDRMQGDLAAMTTETMVKLARHPLTNWRTRREILNAEKQFGKAIRGSDWYIQVRAGETYVGNPTEDTRFLKQTLESGLFDQEEVYIELVEHGIYK